MGLAEDTMYGLNVSLPCSDLRVAQPLPWTRVMSFLAYQRTLVHHICVVACQFGLDDVDCLPPELFIE